MNAKILHTFSFRRLYEARKYSGFLKEVVDKVCNFYFYQDFVHCQELGLLFDI